MRTRDLLPAFADALKFDFGFPDWIPWIWILDLERKRKNTAWKSPRRFQGRPNNYTALSQEMSDLVSPELKPRDASISTTDAEEKKKLGNEAFSAKKFDDALKFYTEAIALDSNNAVYYSNRSACHASKGAWKESVEDAKQCITKDPKFIKGYYRLSVAQMELGLFDDATSTGT